MIRKNQSTKVLKFLTFKEFRMDFPEVRVPLTASGFGVEDTIYVLTDRVEQERFKLKDALNLLFGAYAYAIDPRVRFPEFEFSILVSQAIQEINLAQNGLAAHRIFIITTQGNNEVLYDDGRNFVSIFLPIPKTPECQIAAVKLSPGHWRGLFAFDHEKDLQQVNYVAHAQLECVEGLKYNGEILFQVWLKVSSLDGVAATPETAAKWPGVAKAVLTFERADAQWMNLSL